MFTSKQHLHVNMGVDADIAAFFIDRKVPVNNRYWKGRLLYVSRGTGYLFIPLFFDLQFRCGVSRERVMEAEYIELMEEILSSAAMYEFEEIDFDRHIEHCKSLLKHRVKNFNLYNDLLEYFKDKELKPFKNLGTDSKALNRGDTFLFSLCYLDLEKKLTDKIIENWYALVPCFLLIDDLYDLQEDLQKDQENSVYDFGQGNTGVINAIAFLRAKFKQLKAVNSELAAYFESYLDNKLKTSYFRSLLNN